MKFSGLQAGRSRRWLLAAVVVLATLTVSGCQSKQDAAVEQAKKQAAATGQAQQVVSTDKDGNTVTTVVQPPVPGQSGQVISTTVTPKSAGTPATSTEQSVGSQATGAQTGGAQVGAVTPVPAPAPPPEVHVAAGTTLAIRIDQRISAKGSHAGEKFTGEVVEPVMDGNGGVVIPKKSPVSGVVDFAHQRGHFKGAANIDLRLTSLTLNGKEYPLDTRDVMERKKGKGKRTGALIGGGAGLGMLIGGIASGGTGVLIGGLAGAGAGTAGAGLTGNRDLVIPAESVVRFKLKDDLVIQP